MSRLAVIEKLEKKQLKADIPEFRVGDTIKVHTRIVEGDKERIQVFTGTVIARKGTGLSESVSIHRVAYGAGMERVFLINSPMIAKVEVTRHGDVRRSKLYHLRGTSGKAAKVKGLEGGRKQKQKITEVSGVTVQETPEKEEEAEEAQEEKAEEKEVVEEEVVEAKEAEETTEEKAEKEAAPKETIEEKTEEPGTEEKKEE